MTSLRISSVAIATVVVLAGGLLVTHYRGARTASILGDSTFNQPHSVVWEGTISRRLAGGEGIEVMSSSTEGGMFQAYMPIGQLSPITSGHVVIHGLLVGTTCSYGGCVPEISIQSIESH